MNVGLLMISHENDILERVIAAHEEIVDVFYVLDGTVPNGESRRVCEASPKCGGYLTDAELPHPKYPARPVDGYRQAIYEAAVRDHGYDNWFLLLHGDEIWTFDPHRISAAGPDGFVFDLPFFFPRQGQGWDETRSPLDQLRWRLGPGWPELRMFRGSENVHYQPRQHFNVTPDGLRNIQRRPEQINHYLYRSPEMQRERAERHSLTGFDPDNYAHIRDDKVFWDDTMIRRYMQQDAFRELAYV